VNPTARVEVMGRVPAVHAEEIPADEADAFWTRIVERAPGYERFRRATDRPFPVLRLVPAATA